MKKAGVSGDAPEGNKVDKARAWLERANDTADPLATLGRTLEEVMEADSARLIPAGDINEMRQRVEAALAKHGLAYAKGGCIVRAGTGVAARTFEQIIHSHDLPGIDAEFERITRNVENDPAAAVTAACALLEALFKTYIADEGLELPSKETVKPLWGVVRDHMKFDPATVSDDDLQKVLSGLASIVDGIGSLRTHAGSAHGHGRKTYGFEMVRRIKEIRPNCGFVLLAGRDVDDLRTNATDKVIPVYPLPPASVPYLILSARISDRTYTGFRPVLDCEMPRFSFWRDNRLLHEAQMRTLHERFAATLEDSLKGPRARRTDVLGAFSAAEIVFKQDSRQGRLVLLSDMLEDSESYDFEKAHMTDQFDRQIIARALADHSLPDLGGVTVYVAGASAQNNAKAWEVERFWLAYAKAMNAKLSRERYGPALMSFGE